MDLSSSFKKQLCGVILALKGCIPPNSGELKPLNLCIDSMSGEEVSGWVQFSVPNGNGGQKVCVFFSGNIIDGLSFSTQKVDLDEDTSGGKCKLF